MTSVFSCSWCDGSKPEDDPSSEAVPRTLEEEAPKKPNWAEEEVPKKEAAAKPAPLPEEFHLELHSATLKRSFAKVGWMSPYAVILVNDEEVERSAAAKREDKHPHWDCGHDFRTKELPEAITIAVWDKNQFHRDVFCGEVTIPCSADMGYLEKKDLTLSKKGKSTGTISITMKGKDAEAVHPELPRSQSLVGCEMDDVILWNTQSSKRPLSLTENENLGHLHNQDEDDELHELDTEQKIKPALASDAHSLVGSWKCVDTWGLNDFLKASGVGMFQRKIANAARWPAWDYNEKGDVMVFTNHSAIGDLVEEFPLENEYSWKDGHGNLMTCKAKWTATDDGGTLTTTRSGTVGYNGPIGYKEERCIVGNTLTFSLTSDTGVRWGRKFERA